MHRPLSVFIGLRYTRAKRRNQFISFISLVSLLGMVLGVIALVVVLSVMNGFESELRSRVLAVVPHAYVDGQDNRLDTWPLLSKQLTSSSRVVAAAPYIDSNIMLSRPGLLRPAQLIAVEPGMEAVVSDVVNKMQVGSFSTLEAGKYNIIVGGILARFLGLYVGDEVSVILPKVTVTPFGVFPRVKRFTVSGVFQVGADLDGNTAFIHLKDGQKLFQMGGDVKGLRLKFDDLLAAPQIIQSLKFSELIDRKYSTRTWSQTQGSLFKAVKMEKTMISLLLLVIVAIAAFNIISILSMMVSDKRSDIAVLRTMGASPGTIQSIFMIQGMAIGLTGIFAGIIIGVPIAMYAGDIVVWFESLLGNQVFSPDVYFISRIPSELQWGDIALVSVSGILLSMLATIYPAKRAANVQPAEALRYE